MGVRWGRWCQQRILDVIGEVCVEGVPGGVDTAAVKFLAGIYRH